MQRRTTLQAVRGATATGTRFTDPNLTIRVQHGNRGWCVAVLCCGGVVVVVVVVLAGCVVPYDVCGFQHAVVHELGGGCDDRRAPPGGRPELWRGGFGCGKTAICRCKQHPEVRQRWRQGWRQGSAPPAGRHHGW